MRTWWWIYGLPSGPIGPFHADQDVAYAMWNPLNSAAGATQGKIQLWYYDRGQWVHAAGGSPLNATSP